MVSYTQQQQQQQHMNQKNPLSGQKPPAKKPASSSAKPRVYNVKPIHFRELVQQLTGAPPATNPDNAPVPIMPQKPQPSSSAAAYAAFSSVMGEGTELTLSPTSCSWFSFPLNSPRPVGNFGS